MHLRTALTACALIFLLTAPSFADNDHDGRGGHWHWGHWGHSAGHGGTVTHSAPGPVAAVGLPGLVAGGYIWLRRRSRNNQKKT